MVQLSHSYTTTGKKHSFDYTDLCWQMMSLLFNILSRFVMFFFSKEQRSFNFMAAVIVPYLITRKLLLISSELADSHILSPALVAHPRVPTLWWKVQSSPFWHWRKFPLLTGFWMTHLDKVRKRWRWSRNTHQHINISRTEVNRETTVVFAQYIVVMVWSMGQTDWKHLTSVTWISCSPDVMETHSFTKY